MNVGSRDSEVDDPYSHIIIIFSFKEIIFTLKRHALFKVIQSKEKTS